MKKLISILVMMAFAVTTSLPAYAMKISDGAKASQTEQTAKEHDCHGHGAAKVDSSKTAQNDKDAHGKCCDKGMCKCIGGACHNGPAKIFGNSGDMLVAFAYSLSRFGSTNESADSALLEGLKRPPRA